jgi:crotonobetainyl-CoA:carnitine CoA-transferase CaiB-like acyl-CoA transferase
MLGLPVARVPHVEQVDSVRSGEGLPGRWHQLRAPGRAPRAIPVVVDLSSLWAGPVCARALAARGAEVVKVESIRRPDGARRGPSVFFDRLHAGHRAVALDFDTAAGRDALRALVMAADVVIEASRPRALAQLDVRPDVLGPAGPPVWVSLTGHGREGPAGDRVAFGDDAAAGAGLVAPTPRGPVFVADAIADPLTGLAAAAAASRALRRSGRWLVDVSLSSVAAWVAAGGAAGNAWDTSAWAVVDEPPPPRPVDPSPAAAPALGAHTAEVLATLGAVSA